MTDHFKTSLLLLFSLIMALGCLQAQSDGYESKNASFVRKHSNSERIIHFDSTVHVQMDGSLRVSERITVNVTGNEISRGIFRDFPQKYRDALGIERIQPFEVEKVLRNGKSENYSIEKIGSGTRVKIGNPNYLLPHTQHTYELVYQTSDHLLYFEEYDELYWNVTGNYWEFPIDNVTAKVVLPSGFKVLAIDAYTGEIGSKNQGAEIRFSDHTAEAFAGGLHTGEGLTISVVWPAGMLNPAVYKETSFWSTIRDNWMLGFALVAFLTSLITFFVLWIKVGRDPKKGTIIPRYEPPRSLSPAEMRYMKRRKTDDTCFSATVIHLAAEGMLDISKERKYYHLKGKRVSTRGTSITSLESQVFSKLTANSKRKVVLSQRNASRLLKAKGILKSGLNELGKKYFFSNRKEFWIGACISFFAVFLWLFAIGQAQLMIAALMMCIPGFFLLAGLTLVRSGWESRDFIVIFMGILFSTFSTTFIGGLLLMMLKEAGNLTTAIIGFTVVANVVFYHLIKAPSKEARKILDEIAGFEEYLKVAEEDRLNLENPPEHTPELFEKFLPYALALDLDQEWSEKFEDVLQQAAIQQGIETGQAYQPSFYDGPAFKSSMFSKASSAAIGSAISGALATAATRPRSSGSSHRSSGNSYGSSSSGGSSGGGSGGGGGGGW